jgi:hypothetical protein
MVGVAGGAMSWNWIRRQTQKTLSIWNLYARSGLGCSIFSPRYGDGDGRKRCSGDA